MNEYREYDEGLKRLSDIVDLALAVERAKAYISGALAAMLDLGSGSGPMDHGWDIGENYGSHEL